MDFPPRLKGPSPSDFSQMEWIEEPQKQHMLIYLLIPSSEFNPTMGARVKDKLQIESLRKYRGEEAANKYEPKPFKAFLAYEDAAAEREKLGKEEVFQGAGFHYRYDICVADVVQ